MDGGKVRARYLRLRDLYEIRLTVPLKILLYFIDISEKKMNEVVERNVSSRCKFACQNDALPYKKAMQKGLRNPCHETRNKDGYIVLCRAENKLLLNDMQEKLATIEFARVAFGSEQNYCYNDDVRGFYDVRETVARFITRNFISPDEGCSDSSDMKIMAQSEQIVLTAGAESIIHNLCYLLGEENDAILIPAPYYAGFDNDARVRIMKEKSLNVS